MNQVSDKTSHRMNLQSVCAIDVARIWIDAPHRSSLRFNDFVENPGWIGRMGVSAPGGSRETAMTLLKWALMFFVVSIVAGVLGFTGVSAASADVARFLFYVFVVIFLILLILGLTIFRA